MDGPYMLDKRVLLSYVYHPFRARKANVGQLEYGKMIRKWTNGASITVLSVIVQLLFANVLNWPLENGRSKSSGRSKDGRSKSEEAQEEGYWKISTGKLCR